MKFCTLKDLRISLMGKLMCKKILIVEDESDIHELLKYSLEQAGFLTGSAWDGKAAVALLKNNDFDLVLLDIMLPAIDGLEVCRIIRSNKKTSSLPVIMLTARDEEKHVLDGFGRGADDYISKPFSPRVLLARINSILRRAETVDGNAKQNIVHGELVIFPDKRIVRVEGLDVKLTFTEFQMLLLLAKKPGRVFSRYQIVDSVRGEDHVVTERAIDVHMVSLRKKLSNCGMRLKTVRGVGYKFCEEES
jgi:two-component system, OmpR family, alkaline phosphatase synthesis response regulator PhoP